MTYMELYGQAQKLFADKQITIGQRDEMTKPLWDEIRKKGQWEKITTGISWHYECSNCHEKPLYTSNDQQVLSDYCPHCGADMRFI